MAGIPLVHFVRGADPATGRRPPAIGIIAIGQVAIGVVAIGQLAVGLLAIGQLAIGALTALGQLAFAAVAIGQIAGGLYASLGQAALGPHTFGIVETADPGWTLVWAAGGIALAFVFLQRDAAAAAWTAAARRRPTEISLLDDGVRWIVARIVSPDRLSAPVTERPCAAWLAMRTGPGVKVRERGGERLAISDGTGTAEVVLDGASLVVRNGSHADAPAPDWTTQAESLLSHGETIHVLGPVTIQPSVVGEGSYRANAFAPVFKAQTGADVPLLVSTVPPAVLAASRAFTAAIVSVVAAVAAGTAASTLATWMGF